MSEVPPAGSMQLFDQVAPVMQDGVHRITTTVSFQGAPGATDLTHHDFFEVGGSAAGLSATEVLANHPPRDATGSFADVLPHVVLSRRTLPWERAALPGLDEPFASPLDDDPRRAPWLALVVFRADEADVRSRVRLADAVGQRVAQLFGPDGLPPDATVDAVAVHDPDLLRRVLPTAREIRLLAHVRRVNTADSALDMNDDDGWLAVVTANRLPRPVDGQPTRYLAALVSLEHRDDLYGGAGDVFPGLLCLYSWSFTTAAGGDFATLAGNLDSGLLGGSAPADEHGRVTLKRSDRAGQERQTAYRGPLAPVTGTVPEQADDVSHAAAFELGRLLGAADPMVAPALVEWHRTLSGAATRDIQHRSAHDALAAAGTAPPPPVPPHAPVPGRAVPASESPAHIRIALGAVEALLDRLAPPAPTRRAAPLARDGRTAAAAPHEAAAHLVHLAADRDLEPVPVNATPDTPAPEEQDPLSRLARLASHRRTTDEEEAR